MKRRSVAVVGLVVAGVLVVSGCGPVGGGAPSVTPSPVVSSTPVSPSASVAGVISKPVLPTGWVDRLDGSTATIPLGSAVMKALTGTDKGMVFNKTDAAYENLIAGSKDLILVTYPSVEEFQLAKDSGVELEVVPVVRDALVFLANTKNPVPGLTSQQVKDIYTGKLTNWADVGGSADAIIPYQRPVNSGSQTLFLKLAMGDTTPMDAPTELRPASMDTLVDVIADYDNSVDALGYSVFYYATEMYLKDTVKLVPIDGVMPSPASISDESYPYGTYYYAVLRKNTPVDDPARQVLAWMLGDEAQQLASRQNYVPLEARNVSAPQPEYGYFGSTPENTTQSSGTGGTVPLSVDPLPPSKIHCQEDERSLLASLVIDGHPAMAEGILRWYQTTTNARGLCDASLITPDIALVSVYQDDLTTGVTSMISAAVSDSGKLMTLSDFFYDGVNYIAYINQNLFNEATNPNYADYVYGSPDGVDPHSPLSGFTGLPRDYANFSAGAIFFGYGFDLAFSFPDGNPLFPTDPYSNGGGAETTTNAGSMALSLPADLSPFGRVPSAVWTTSAAGQTYPVLTTTSTPSAKDEALNRRITDLVAANPGKSCFVMMYGRGRAALVANTAGCNTGPGPVLTGGPVLVGQWNAVTWVDDPMTEADLPADWRTAVAGPFREMGGYGTVCPVGRASDTECTVIKDPPGFTDRAVVTAVWAYPWLDGLEAVILDGTSYYMVLYAPQ